MAEAMAAMAGTPLVALTPKLPEASQPTVLPVPAGGVKVLPRWADADDVLRWRLRYRTQSDGEPDAEGKDGNAKDGQLWQELELRNITRELPLTGLQHGQRHLFAVALETPMGWSRWSRLVSAVPPSPKLPGRCAAVFAVVQDDTTALVRWTRPVDFAAAVNCGVTKYKLLVTQSEGASCEDASDREILIEEDTDSYEVGDLKPLRDYYFHVASYNITGWGEYSDPSPKLNMPPPVPPRLPQPTLRRATHHSVVIQWQHPPASDVAVDSFRFRWTTSEDWKTDVAELNDVDAHLSQHVIMGLRPGASYQFQVSALNQYGKGIWSESSLPAKTLDPYPPSKIEAVEVPEKFRSFLTLQWPPAEANGYEVTRHVVRCSKKPDMSDAEEMEPAVERKNGADTCNLRHLRKMQYYFQIAAFNKMGMSEWSDPVDVDLSVTPKLEDA